MILNATADSSPFEFAQGANDKQENEQLKAHVADLQKQNGELGNNLETVTASRDALSKENDDLRAQIAAMKSNKPKKRVSSRRNRRR